MGMVTYRLYIQPQKQGQQCQSSDRKQKNVRIYSHWLHTRRFKVCKSSNSLKLIIVFLGWLMQNYTPHLTMAAASVGWWVTLWLCRICLSSKYWTDFYIACCWSEGSTGTSFSCRWERSVVWAAVMGKKIKLPSLGEGRWNLAILTGFYSRTLLQWSCFVCTDFITVPLLSTNDIVWYGCGTVWCLFFFLHCVCLTTEARANMNRSSCECFSAGWLQHHVLASKWGYIGLPPERWVLHHGNLKFASAHL